MKKTDMSPNAKLSFVERIGYGIGDYAGNLVYSAISAFYWYIIQMYFM